MLGDPLDTALRRWLLPGEQLLWTGQPAQGVRFTRHDFYLIPFSLLWGGFALVWNVADWRMGGPLLMRLFGLPFLAAGFYIVFGRFLLDAFLRRLTVYGVSNRRVLILRRPPLERLRSFEIGHLPFLEYEEQRNGFGTIRFDDDDEPASLWTHPRADPWLPGARAASFDRIADSRRVYDLIVRETERWRREQYGSGDRSFIG